MRKKNIEYWIYIVIPLRISLIVAVAVDVDVDVDVDEVEKAWQSFLILFYMTNFTFLVWIIGGFKAGYRDL